MNAKNKPHKRITLADVAQEAGVSRTTVSRVINESDDVLPKTTHHVQATIKKLGYTPQTAARNLAKRQTSTLGVLLRSIGNDFAAQLLYGIERYSSLSDYDLLITSKHTDENGELLPTPLGLHNTDGLVVMTGCLKREDIIKLYKMAFPLLLLYELPPDDLEIPSIQIENRTGTRLLIDHMIEIHGCKRFAFLRGPKNNHDSSEREQGLRESLNSHGLALQPDLIGYGNYQETDSQQVVQDWIRKGKNMDVIFGGSDEGAIGAMMALKNEGVAVPDDIAVIGFDDMQPGRLLSPPLTTVHAPTEKIGRLAVETLIKIIRGESVEPVKILSTELVIRQSCGCNNRG